MTAITSQTFQHGHGLSLSHTARQIADVATSAWRLLARSLVSTTTRVRSHAAEAAEVRALAQRWQKTDPGFASDLYAAAARHEGLDD
jgi:hypothetical protein